MDGVLSQSDLQRLEEGGVSDNFCFEDIVAAHPKKAYKW